ncbi:MAG: PEGA domain-containing protein [Archangium sp.]|nr:PEGA domain-containing protein [Archangium sp.]
MRSQRSLCLCLFLATAAHAQVATPAQRKEAATHYQRGVALSKEGDFAAALSEFRAAYQSAPSYEVLFNIGFCERRTFKYGQALRTFAQYLKLGGDKVAADRRAAVAREIEAVRALTAPVAVIVEGEPATITVDGEKEGQTPLTDFIPLGPGKHVVRAEREGDVAEERTIEVVSGQAQAVQFSLRSLSRPVEVVLETRPSGALVSIDGAPAAPSPRTVQLKPGAHEVVARLDGHTPARTDVVVQPGQPRSVTLELVAVAATVAAPQSRPFPIVGVSLLSAGLIAGGLGVFFAAQATSSAAEVTAFARPGAATWDAQWVNTERTGQQQMLAAQLLLGGGGALVLSGVIATFVSAFADSPRPAAKLMLFPTAQGAHASCVVSF